jgi:RNA polymerase sigma-70 factor, ECF subfamily
VSVDSTGDVDDYDRMALSNRSSQGSPADAQLLARLADGDEAAFNEIFRTWYAALVRFAERLLSDRARAEEAVQDVMLSLWRQRASLYRHTSAQAWLFRATRNRALNVLRHDRVTDRTEAGVMSAAQLRELELADAADDALSEAEMYAAVAAAIDELPPKCRRVFLLSRVDGLPHAQICARLGIGQKAVEAHITRAMRTLRQRLAPWLSTPRA